MLRISDSEQLDGVFSNLSCILDASFQASTELFKEMRRRRRRRKQKRNASQDSDAAELGLVSRLRG